MKTDSEIEKPVQRLREQLKLATTEAILAAAEGVFAERGLHLARMEEIASRAGVAVGTLYNHFADRSALLEALRGARQQALMGRLDAELAASKGKPFPEQLRGFAGAMFEHVASHYAFTAAVIQAEQSKPHALVRELEGRAQKLMQRGLAQKAVRADHAELHATIFMSIVRAVLEREMRENEGQALADHTQAVVDFFLQGAGA